MNYNRSSEFIKNARLICQNIERAAQLDELREQTNAWIRSLKERLAQPEYRESIEQPPVPLVKSNPSEENPQANL